MYFLIADICHLGFRDWNDSKTKQQPFQFVSHVEMNEKRQLICTSWKKTPYLYTSSTPSPRNIAFYVFCKQCRQPFGNQTIAEFFKKGISAHFSLNCFR